MLEKSSDEFRRFDGHLSPAIRAALAVGKRHATIITGDDPPIADGHPKNIRRKILQRSLAIANGLGVDNPSLTPHFRIDLCEQASLAQSVAELGSKQHREGTHRDEKMRM